MWVHMAMNPNVCVFLRLADSCTDPVISPSAYTTNDAVISSESVFIVELSLACANGAQVNVNLHHSFVFEPIIKSSSEERLLAFFLML